MAGSAGGGNAAPSLAGRFAATIALTIGFYRDLVARHRELLDGITVSALGHVAAEPEPIATALRQREAELDDEQAAGFARHLLGASLTLALVRSGWRGQALPGEPVCVVRGDDRIVPSDIVADLAAGETTPGAWRERAASLGIADDDLGMGEPEPARAT